MVQFMALFRRRICWIFLLTIKLKQHIGLDDSDSELDPQNPNVRGVHNDEGPKDPLEVIIQTSNNKNYNFMMFFKPLSTNDLYLMLVSYSVIGRIICTIFPYNNTGKIVSRETFFLKVIRI